MLNVGYSRAILALAIIMVAYPPSIAFGQSKDVTVNWDESLPTHFFLCPAGDGDVVEFGFNVVDINGNPFPNLDFKGYLADASRATASTNPLHVHFCDPDPANGQWMTTPSDVIEVSLGSYHWSEVVPAGLFNEPEIWGAVAGLSLNWFGEHYNFWKPAAFVISSPDLDGDGIVNLVDVQLFASYYGGDYDSRIDFNRNGREDLGDVAAWSAHNGHSCW